MSFRNKFTLKAEGSFAPYFCAKMDGVRGFSETRFGEEAFPGIKCKYYIHLWSKFLSAYLACVAGIYVTKAFVALLGKCAGNYLIHCAKAANECGGQMNCMLSSREAFSVLGVKKGDRVLGGVNWALG